MALTSSVVSHNQVRNISIGRVVTDAVAAVDTAFTVGYAPRFVRWINLTDGTQLEWFEGMAADSAISTAATGVPTLITTNGLTVNTTINGFSLKAVSIPASKTFTYECIG